MPGPILTLYDQHAATCGTSLAFSNGDLYVVANQYREQWIFTLDRATGWSLWLFLSPVRALRALPGA